MCAPETFYRHPESAPSNGAPSSSERTAVLGITPPSAIANPWINGAAFKFKHESLSNGMRAEIALRPLLPSFSGDEVGFAAYIFIRGGLRSTMDIKLSLPLNRKYFTHELRGGEFPRRALLMISDVSRTPPPTLGIAILDIRRSERFVARLGSIVRISRLRAFRASFAGSSHG